jgi:hypothetical protein
MSESQSGGGWFDSVARISHVETVAPSGRYRMRVIGGDRTVVERLWTPDEEEKADGMEPVWIEVFTLYSATDRDEIANLLASR